MKQLEITLRIKCSLDNVALVGVSINALCHSLNPDPALAQQVELCVVEACNNAIRHAYGGESDGTVDIDAVFEADRIIIHISDTGQPRTASAIPGLDFDPEDLENLPESGMGLFLIYEIMDDVQYTSANGINTLTMIKNLSARAGGEHS